MFLRRVGGGGGVGIAYPTLVIFHCHPSASAHAAVFMLTAVTGATSKGM